mgnify:CR=1 FL=1
MANAGQTIPEGYLGVLAPLGYHYIDHPNEILSGIVLGDGSLLLRIYFEATEGATSYTVEHYIIDGKKNVTLLNSEVIDGVYRGPGRYDRSFALRSGCTWSSGLLLRRQR